MAEEAKAYWKGHIRLSLVNFPVKLYAAVSDSKKVHLHKISKKSNERIHYKDSTESQGLVAKEDIVKGYEYEKGHYVEINDKELKKLKAESSHTIDLVQFTDLKDIDPIFFDKPYFIAPDGKLANEAYITLRDALAGSKKVALGQIVIAGRERIAAIKACQKGLILETLRYSYEIRDAEKYFEDVNEKVRISKDQVELAELLIKSKSKKFDPKSFKDTYQEDLLKLIKSKVGKHPVKTSAAKREKPDNVVDIMDALKKSLSGAKNATSKKPAKTAPKKRARK
jgi:DNA end-binding protein Ku